MANWTPFWGAMGGAIVGSVLTLMGAWLVTQKATMAVKQSALKARAIQRPSATLSAFAEMQANLWVPLMPETPPRNTFVPFSVSKCATNQQVIAIIAALLEVVVQTAYAEIFIAKAVASHNIHIPYVRGMLNDRHKDHVAKMTNDLWEAIPRVENTLSDLFE